MTRKSFAILLVFCAAMAMMACAAPPSSAPLSAANSDAKNKGPVVAEAPAGLTAGGFVNDYADVLDATASGELEKILRELQAKAGIEVVIAIVESTNGRDIYDFSLALAREWKMGSENGGAVLVIATEDRAWHLQIDRRLEKDLTNEEVKQIGDTMTPDLKQNNYAAALKRIVKRLVVVLAEKRGFEPPVF